MYKKSQTTFYSLILWHVQFALYNYLGFLPLALIILLNAARVSTDSINASKRLGFALIYSLIFALAIPWQTSETVKDSPQPLIEQYPILIIASALCVGGLLFLLMKLFRDFIIERKTIEEFADEHLIKHALFAPKLVLIGSPLAIATAFDLGVIVSALLGTLSTLLTSMYLKEAYPRIGY